MYSLYPVRHICTWAARMFWGRCTAQFLGQDFAQGCPAAAAGSLCCGQHCNWCLRFFAAKVDGLFKIDFCIWCCPLDKWNHLIWPVILYQIYSWSGYHQHRNIQKHFSFGFWQTSSKHLVLLQGCTAQRCKISDDHDTVTSRVVQHWRLSLRIAFRLAAFRSSQPRLIQHCNPARMTVRLLSRSCSIFVQLDRHV